MKILVVGGGPAGSTISRYLANKFDVILIQDKKWKKPCGGGTKTKIFKEFDLDTNLIKEKFNSLKMIYKNNTIDLSLLGDNLSIVFRDEFDEYLRNKAKENGVTIIYDKLIDIQKNTAILQNQQIDFDILIAADGVHSNVRKLLNLPDLPKVLTHYALIDKKVDKPLFYFDKLYGGNFYAWEFPHQNKTHIGSDYKTFINFTKYLDINTKHKGYFIPKWEENITIQKNNIYFVGDSAAQVMPLTFEGIYYAMESAKILAHCIINNLDYKTEWNKRFLKQFKFMKFIEKSMQNKFLRNIIMFGFTVPIFQKISVKLWLEKIKL
jgi:geranylgeranyl reductase